MRSRYLRCAAWIVVCGVGLAAATEARQPAAGFDAFFMHDECIADNTEQPDTCLHERRHDKSFTFDGRPGVVYDVTLRIRGLFEPTTIAGGVVPDAAHPWFVAGARVARPTIPAGTSTSPRPPRPTRSITIRRSRTRSTRRTSRRRYRSPAGPAFWCRRSTATIGKSTTARRDGPTASRSS